MNNEINYEELDFQQFNIDESLINQRIDKFLSIQLPHLSRSYIQDLIKEKYVFVNNEVIKPSYKLEENDVIIIYFKPVSDYSVEAQDIPINIIYEDKDIAIIDKPAGMVVHPSPGHHSNTLVNALLFHIKDLSSINGEKRPGIVHRIDMDTSGLIAIAKNDEAHKGLSEQLKDHSMSRTYMAIAKGIFASRRGTIKTLIGRDKKNRLKQAVVNDNGKEAITDFEVLETIKDKYSIVKCDLQTGRTHQIRVHLAFIKHPIINDPLYGENNRINFESGQLLHAYKLRLIHPITKEEMEFEAPLPEHFKKAIELLKQ